MTSAESPAEILARIAARARRVETPSGAGRMVWHIWGEGPPLVLLHGGYGSWRHWIRTIPHFERHYRLLVADIPGLGESDDAPDGTPEGIAAVVSAGLESLIAPDEELDLAGFSFGAMIASHVAGLYPRPPRSLTLVGPGGLGLSRSNVVLLRAEPGMSVDEVDAVNRQNLGLLMIADPAKIDDLAVAIQGINVRLARVKSRRFARTASLTEALQRARCGRLNAIWGAGDVVVGGHFAEREELLRSIRPDVSFNIIPDAGHWVPYEAPDAFNRLFESVLQRDAL